jgi:hypothetical protein
LTQLINNQEAIGNKYFRSPLSVGVTALLTAAFSAALLLVAYVIAALVLRPIGSVRGRKRVKIGPFVDLWNGNAGHRIEHVVPGVLKVIRNHFRPRPLIRNNFTLPILAKSQSPEIKEIIEATAPGGLGKLLVWIYQRRDRPRYSIQGLVDYTGRRRFLFISLNDRNDKVQEWENTNPLVSLSADKNLVLEILLRLILHMNR